MSSITERRTLPWDWFAGTIPENVVLDDSAYVETSFSFFLYRSERTPGVTIGRGASTYLGTMFDVGRNGRVTLGDYALVHGARIICDSEITIADHALISWNVVLMDSYRLSLDPDARRAEIRAATRRQPRRLEGSAHAAPIRIGRAAWIGFDACVLPGVTIGDGAIIGARSVVASDVEPFTIVAGNPARLVRRLTDDEMRDGH